MKLSIVMPVLNEAATIDATLADLQPMRSRGAEVIVVDGGSTDGTPARATPLADQVIQAPRGRASQMNHGVRRAAGEIVLLLHADTRLPPEADREIAARMLDSGCAWGRFDVVIEGDSPMFPVIAAFMNLRSRLSGIATGDQAIFARRTVLAAIGGVPGLALMEDVALSKALKRVSRPLCLAQRVRTSGRRWSNHGVIRTITLMWALRLAFFLGVSPERLARLYYGTGPRTPA